MIRANQPGLRARIKTGSYTGDGNDNRNIDIGIELLSKDFKWVIIKANSTDVAVHRPDSIAGDATCYFTGSAALANLIQDWTATGFQIGNATNVNQNTTEYVYIAIWSEP